MGKRFRNFLGPTIRRLRVRSDLTQDELAARLQLAGLTNMDRVTVAKVESQIRSLFDFEVIVLAKVLKVDPQELLAIPHQTLRAALPDLIAGETLD